MKLQKDLREFVELLNSHGVDYVVVGGHAVGFHGFPRYTGDIDFLVRPTGENAARLMRTLDAFGFQGIGLSQDDFVRSDRIVQLGTPPNRIDLLTSLSGVEVDEVWAGAVSAEMDGVPVRIIGREALLRNKRAAGRTKDLLDVEQIEKMGR